VIFSGAPLRPSQREESTMPKGQQKLAKSNKPKLSTKEKQDKKKEKKEKKGSGSPAAAKPK
jgi:hypothetical protein